MIDYSKQKIIETYFTDKPRHLNVTINGQKRNVLL